MGSDLCTEHACGSSPRACRELPGSCCLGGATGNRVDLPHCLPDHTADPGRHLEPAAACLPTSHAAAPGGHRLPPKQLLLGGRPSPSTLRALRDTVHSLGFGVQPFEVLGSRGFMPVLSKCEHALGCCTHPPGADPPPCSLVHKLLAFQFAPGAFSARFCFPWGLL